MKQPNRIGGRVQDPTVYDPLFDGRKPYENPMDEEESGLSLDSEIQEINEAFGGLK